MSVYEIHGHTTVICGVKYPPLRLTKVLKWELGKRIFKPV